MARGRHVRRSRLLAWLFPTAPPPPPWRDVHAQSLVLLSDRIRGLEQELARLRGASEGSTASLVMAELRAQRLEEQLAASRSEVAALRADVDALREELVWFGAERRAASLHPVPGRVAGTG